MIINVWTLLLILRLLIGLMTMIGLGLMNLFIGSTGLELALAGGSALIFCLFIVFDTQVSIVSLTLSGLHTFIQHFLALIPDNQNHIITITTVTIEKENSTAMKLLLDFDFLQLILLLEIS